MAGAGIWRTEIAEAGGQSIMENTANLPGFLPGYRHIGHDETMPLAVSGADVPSWMPELEIPDPASTGDVSFSGTGLVVGNEATHVSIQVGRAVSGISILQGIWTTREALVKLRPEFAEPGALGTDMRPAAHLEVLRADGTTERIPMVPGLNTWKVDGDHEIQSLWGGAGVLPVPSHPGLRGTNRVLYRLDWSNDSPGTPVEEVRLVTEVDGVWILCAGATALL